MRNRKEMDLGGKGLGEEQEGIGRGETVIKIGYVRKKTLFNKWKMKENREIKNMR